MATIQAIRVALDLARMPSLFRSTRAMALPSDMTDLIRIATGDEEACASAAAATGASKTALVEAARLFVKQVLFRPDADCFRVLGVSPGAPKSLARFHMRTLLAWLHPDRNQDGDEVFAHRVLSAWSEYSKIADAPVQSAPESRPRRRRRSRRARHHVPIVRTPGIGEKERGRSLWPYLLVGAIGLCVVAAAAFPDKIYAIAQAVPFGE